MTIPHRELPLPATLAAYASGPSRRPVSGTPEAALNWPTEESPPARVDWRERLALATDLALIGIGVTVLALPLVTAPAALSAGSAAVHGRLREGRLPAGRPLLRQYRRGILPGLLVLVAAAALLLDVVAVRGGGVPGGPVLLAVTLLAAVWLTGVAAVALVALGRTPDLPWLAAAKWAWDQPKPTAALALTSVIALVLTLAVPVTLPLMVGFHLFAAHLITTRLTR
jgi:hypothetical protein